jgi:hypothetical protein
MHASVFVPNSYIILCAAVCAVLCRVDLLATLVQLPDKVPQVRKVVAAVTAPPQGWPEVQDVAKMVVKAVGQRLAAAQNA